MLDVALETIKALDAKDRTNYQGRCYSLVDTPFGPKPVNGRLPILIGGTKPKMLRVVGEHADLWERSFKPDELKAGLATDRGHAAEFGRDPGEIVGSARA